MSECICKRCSEPIIGDKRPTPRRKNATGLPTVFMHVECYVEDRRERLVSGIKAAQKRKAGKV